MRADLLEAHACIDWTVSKLKGFGAEVEAWLGNNVSVAIEDLPAPATQDAVVVLKKESFPLTFQVEFGAYLNTIRSSLDILASALGRRHNIPNPEGIYFPVAKSQAHFTAGNYKGKDFVNGLPPTERTLLESLKPYDGGNKCLWILHQLDIKRKHQRLLEIILHPIAFTTPPDFPSDAFTPRFDGWIVPANDKTLLGHLRKGAYASANDLKVTQFIAINEPTLVQPLPAIESLYDFTRFAESVIRLFDI